MTAHPRTTRAKTIAGYAVAWTLACAAGPGPAAAAPHRAPPNRGPIDHLATGGRVLSSSLPLGPALHDFALDARLVIHVRAAARPGARAAGAVRPHATDGPWRRRGESWIRQTDGPGFTATLDATPEPDGVALRATIQYSAPVTVTREAIEITLPGRARAIDRGLDLRALGRPLRVDRGTPVWLATAPARHRAGAAVVAESGIPAARYVPRGRTTRVDLIIDDPGAHPFTTFARCRAHYLPARAPGMPHLRRPPAAMERRTRRDHLERAAGDVVRARARVYVIASRQEFTPVIVDRWPDGARAAVVFTDHADRTDPDALRAVLYGTSSPGAPGYGRGGFFGHHLRITKTFFARPGMGSLEDPAARALAGEIVAHGSEVGAHSITPRRDQRSLVARALSLFSPWKVVTWIDHQPDTNCEAIASRGWGEDKRFGIHDLLATAGFSWVWSDTDVPERAVRLSNVFEPERRTAALPPVYPLPHDPRLWVFDSSWFYDRVRRLASAVSEAQLDRLERQRGLFVAHTYLSASPRTTRRRDFIGRDVVLPVPGGGFRLDPMFDAALGRLGARVARGTIASLTLRQSGDRLRALGGVVVRYPGDGSAVIRNTGAAAIEGLTVAVPDRAVLTVRGAEVKGHRTAAARADEPARSTVWFDLTAGAEAVVRARTPGGRSIALGAGPQP